MTTKTKIILMSIIAAILALTSMLVFAHSGSDIASDNNGLIGQMNQMHKDMIKDLPAQEVGVHNQMHSEMVKQIATGEVQEMSCGMH